MDFDTLLSVYLSWDLDAVMGSFGAEGSWPPARDGDAAPARRLSEVIAPIAEHAVWSRRTNEAMEKLGLSFVPAYMWGRVAPLGDVPAEVAVAAVAVYEPRIVTAVLDAARRQCGRAGMLAAREEATVGSLRDVLGDADVREAVAVLRRGVAAADPTGRMFFSALAPLPWPASPVGQLWRACDMLREHRGDSHMIAWLGAGLGPVSANLLTEAWLGMPLGLYTAMRRGWSEGVVGAAAADLTSRGLIAAGAITPEGRALRDEIEQRTDALQQPVIDAMGADFGATVQALDAWSAAVADSGAFPPGTYRRSAGELASRPDTAG